MIFPNVIFVILAWALMGGGISGRNLKGALRLRLQNVNKECWTSCRRQAGRCSFCGTGSCCRKGDTRGAGCTGANGCDGNHCCVLPFFLGMYKGESPDQIRGPSDRGHRTQDGVEVMCVTQPGEEYGACWAQCTRISKSICRPKYFRHKESSFIRCKHDGDCFKRHAGYRSCNKQTYDKCCGARDIPYCGWNLKTVTMKPKTVTAPPE